jgi:hypothetical protein
LGNTISEKYFYRERSCGYSPSRLLIIRPHAAEAGGISSVRHKEEYGSLLYETGER